MKKIKVKIAAVALLINLNVFANNSDNEKQNCQLLDDIARLNATHIQNPKDEDNNAEFLEKLLEAQLHPSCELTTEQKDIIVDTYNSFLAAPNKEHKEIILGTGAIVALVWASVSDGYHFMTINGVRSATTTTALIALSKNIRYYFSQGLVLNRGVVITKRVAATAVVAAVALYKLAR